MHVGMAKEKKEKLYNGTVKKNWALTDFKSQLRVFSDLNNKQDLNKVFKDQKEHYKLRHVI